MQCENYAGAPFAIDSTPAHAAWLEELDYVDPHVGALEELAALARKAPTPSAGRWLRMHIQTRQRIEGRGESN